MDVSNTLDCTSIEEKDLVSRYVGRKLSPEEAEAFEEHYFGCDRCWEQVQRGTEVRAALAEEGVALRQPTPRTINPRVIRGPWRSVGLFAAAAALVLGIAGALILGSREASGIEPLARVVGHLPFRTVEARLTGPFHYLPLAPVTRGSTERPLPLDVRRAALNAQKRAEDRPTAVSLNAAGVAHLILGEADEAIARLEEARQLHQRGLEISILNNLAAAYITRARQRSERSEGSAAVSDYEAALKNSEDVLRWEPRSQEALFNRALVLETRSLREEAAKAWRKYLEVDKSSGWSKEAFRHLAKPPTDSELWDRQRQSLDWSVDVVNEEAARAVAWRFPQQSRTYAQDKVLPAWGDAVCRGMKESAASALGLARLLGRVLSARFGDFLLSDSVEAIERAGLPRSPAWNLDALARGHIAYGKARASFERLEIVAAAKEFEDARTLLTRGGSPFANVAPIGLAACQYYRNDLRSGLETTAGILKSQLVKSARYPSLAAQLRWSHGFGLGMLGYPNEAIEEHEVAAEAFERLAEKENAAAVHGLLSEAFEYLGDDDRSWFHLDRALALLHDAGTVSRRPAWLAAAARKYTAQNRATLASAIHRRLVAEAFSTGRQDAIADAFLTSALSRYRAGRAVEAEEDLRHARLALARIRDPAVRRRVEANLDLSEVTLARGARDAGDLNRIGAALEFFRSTDNHLKQAQLYLARGRIRALRGDSPAAQADFENGIAEIEKQLERLTSEDLRVQYFETGRQLFEARIGALVADGNSEQAFLYADRAHGRALLDDISGFSRPSVADSRVVKLLRSSDIPHLMPARSAFIQYFALPKELLIWVIHDQGIRMVRKAIDRRELIRLVEDLRNPLDGGATSRRTLADLGLALIAPIKPLIERFPHLILAPDRELHRVPLAAILQSNSGAYLVEKHDIAVVPSAATFLQLRIRTSRSTREPSVLAVAGPPSAPLLSLRHLQRVDEECQQISRFYPRPRLLSGELATKDSFLNLAPSYSVIHFAGHAMANMARPDLSMLVFAPGGRDDDSGYLYSHELASVDLSKARVVVLAACSTAAGRTFGSEGVFSLARSFLAAGASTVVASLWPVGDESTAHLLITFHRELQSGVGPAAALRAAQLNLLRSSDRLVQSPVSWSGFQVYGVP